MPERSREGAEKEGFLASHREAVYGLLAYTGQDRQPALEALARLRAENEALYSSLNIQMVNELSAFMATARQLGIPLLTELQIRLTATKVLSQVPGLKLRRRTLPALRKERSRIGLDDRGNVNTELVKFLDPFQDYYIPLVS
jgi:hypothetical protein